MCRNSKSPKRTWSAILRCFNQWLELPDEIPDQLTQGRTVPLPKTEDLSSERTCHPISCFNTCYKIFTDMTGNYMKEHAERNNIWDRSQLGTCSGVLGTANQLIIDNAIMDEVSNQQRTDFPNYNNFENINDAYSNFVQKVMGVIDLVAPVKSRRIKQNSQEWFDGEVAEKINVRDKLFKKFKKSKLHIDKEINKIARYEVQKFIQYKKKKFSENRLNDSLGKPKELWKALKSLGLPSKTSVCGTTALKVKNTTSFETKSTLDVFKNYYSTLA